MSETVMEPEVRVEEQDVATAEFVVRTFEANLEAVEDGRTLIGRVMPYNERALVADPPTYTPYYEEWLPGVFDQNTKAANRVLLDFEHHPGIQGIIGRALTLHSELDGFYGSFKVYPNADGDKALEMYHDEVLRSFSVYAKPLRTIRADDGTMRRSKAHLDRVALCRRGAFENAKVLSARADPVVVNEEDLPKQFDPELAQLFRSFGVAVPDELLAPLLRAFTEQTWDGSAARFADTAAYCRSCVIDDNAAGPKIQALCHLPVREPNGDVNVNAVRNALARLDQVQTSGATKTRARGTLERMLAQFNKGSGDA
jgi:HK97 family phage prohead protease